MSLHTYHEEARRMLAARWPDTDPVEEFEPGQPIIGGGYGQWTIGLPNGATLDVETLPDGERWYLVTLTKGTMRKTGWAHPTAIGRMLDEIAEYAA